MNELVQISEPVKRAIRHDVAHFDSFDGTRLFYRSWIHTHIAPTKAIILLHRGHEHSGRYLDLAARLDVGDDVAIFAYDARGHGRSPGERGWAPSFAALVRDADCFAKFIAREHAIAIEDMAVVGHSVGAVVAATWVHDYAPRLRAMVLATPALEIKLYVPLALPGLRARNKVRSKSFITSYVRPTMLTHDESQQRGYRDDSLISKRIATNVLLDVHDASRRIVKDAGAIRTPTLILTAGADWVVKNSTTRTFFERLGATRKTIHELDGFSHAIFHEVNRVVPATLTRDFLAESFEDDDVRTSDLGVSPARDRVSNEESERPARSRGRDAHATERALLRADQQGPSFESFARLNRPRPIWCPKRWSFAAQRAFLKTLGRLSHGVSLGWTSGFSSGQSLDHVYENVARGRTLLGRIIDRFYLNAIGWRMIRQRKMNLQTMLHAAIDDATGRARKDGRPVRVLDIAAGPGRYLIETVKQFDGRAIATCRDRDKAGLLLGRQIAAQVGVSDRVTHEAGDAFDADALATISPAPDIAIVSGLYELFPSNRLILDSLRGLSAAMNAGATLIYTNQPWHPELEMIARVLAHGDGSPWIMRCRSQAEMDALVCAAGFEKVDQRIDEHGIFSVSIARKL